MRLLMSNKTLWASNEHQTSLLKWRLLDLKPRPAPQCQQLLWSFIWLVPASAVTGTCLLVCPGKGEELFAKSVCLSLCSSVGCILLCHPFRPLWQLPPIPHAWLTVVRPQIMKNCLLYQPSSLACLLPLERDCSVSDVCDFLLDFEYFRYFMTHFHEVVEASVSGWTQAAIQAWEHSLGCSHLSHTGTASSHFLWLTESWITAVIYFSKYSQGHLRLCTDFFVS